MTWRCDLVLLSWNHLECTRPCVESLLANTTVPSRLIIIDQGSNEETVRYLRSISSSASVTVDLIFNPTNVGFPKGMNIGLKKATAPYVCFLNNDILVPPGWLEELIAVAESDPSIGAVNPNSNTFGAIPPAGATRQEGQVVRPPLAETTWLAFARASSTQRGRWVEINYGVGFCLLVKREILARLGGFDEKTYGQAYFEDADLGRQIQMLGLRCVMAKGTYVWHHGGKSTASLPDRLRLFQENERRFIQKWGKGRRVLYAVRPWNPQQLSRLAEDARAEANRSGSVWLLLGSSNGKLPEHLNIRVIRLNRWVLPWVALWQAFTKKKKFDRMITDQRWLGLVLGRVRFLHRASVELLS